MTTRRHLQRVAAIVAGVLVVLVVGLWLGVPAAVRWGIETVAARELGRTMHVADVRFNPFTLRLVIDGLAIDAAAAGEPALLQLDRLDAQIGTSSIFRLAPVVRALRLQGLRIHLARTGPNRLSISDIVERLTTKPLDESKPADDSPARFAVYNIELTDGAVMVDDRVVGQTHRATGITLGIPFISSLPTYEDVKVRPVFAATINGAPFRLDGETLPFGDSHDTSVALRFDGLALPRYLDYSPFPLGFGLTSGALDTDLRIIFRSAVEATAQTPAEPARLLLSGTAAIRDLALVPADMKLPLVRWQRLAVDVAEVGLFEQRGALKSVTLDEPTVNLVRRADGSLAGVDRLLATARPNPPSAANAPPSATPAAQAFLLDVAQIQVTRGRIDFADDTVGFKRRLQPIALTVEGFSTRRDAQARLTLTAAADDKTQLAVNGSFGVAPVAVDAEAGVTQLPLAGLAPYLRGVLDASVSGEVDARARLRLDDGAVRVEAGQLKVASLRVAGQRGNRALLRVPAIAVDGVGADVAARSVTIDSVAVRGARLQAARDAEGRIDLQRMIVAQRPSSGPSAPAWRVQVTQFDLNGARAVLRDEAVTPPAAIAVDALNARVRGIATAPRTRMAVDVRARLGGGALRATGWVRAEPLATQLKLQIDNVDVSAARPYTTPHVSAILASAAVTGNGDLAVEMRGDAPAVRYDGTLRVTNFLALNPDGETQLARWQALALDTVQLDTGAVPPRIDIGRIGLNDFYARAILSTEGKLNLVQALQPAAGDGTDGAPARPPAPGPAAAPAASTSPAGGAAAASATSAGPMQVRIGGIELLRGNVNFTDNFVKPNYTANLTDLAGTVGALSSTTPEMADVSVSGRIDGDAPLEITGKLNPLASELALDIRGSAKGVELPRLTPYSVKYAGYPITKGKLSVDVSYLVQQGKLTAQNRIVLDQLTFGDRVESPTATKLPVLFAVSLLKDRNGQIDVNLPIAGSLSDPEFSIGGIIVRVIVNLIVKAVTSPFALLGAAFGGGADLGYLQFAPGTTAIADAELNKLDALAKALYDRPALKLEVTGRALAAADAEPLRRVMFENKLRAAKVRELVRAGQSVDPDSVTVAADERERLIGAVYREEKIPDKPRNFLGIAKSIPAADMERLILGTLKVEQEDLRRLANDRASRVRDLLVGRGKVARDRIFVVAPALDAATGEAAKLAPSRADFSLK